METGRRCTTSRLKPTKTGLCSETLSLAYRPILMDLRSKKYERALREANRAFQETEPRGFSALIGGVILAYGILLLLTTMIVTYR